MANESNENENNELILSTKANVEIMKKPKEKLNNKAA